MSKSLNLIKDPIGPLLRKIAIPASVGTLFQTLFNVVDTYFAGKISPDALSALADQIRPHVDRQWHRGSYAPELVVPM